METFKSVLILILVIVVLAADWSEYLPAGWVLVTHEELQGATDDAVVYAIRAVDQSCYADLNARQGDRVPIVCR
jgi:hypothetical protein